MSALPILLFIVGIVVSIIRKSAQKQQQQVPRQRRAPMPPPATATTSKQQQSAWEWMHSDEAEEKDPEGETQMYRDMPEEWIHPVETSVKMDLSELQESPHELMQATVRESIKIRRPGADEASQAAQTASKPRQKLALNTGNVAQALMLSELLGEPRSKRPWNPRGKR